MTRYAVAGGGIAGLAAAWELRRSDPDAEVTVYEPGHLGGKLRTSPFAGRPLDEGADAFLARVPEGHDLCAELGLADRLVTPATGVAYVARGRYLDRLPTGLVLGVPTDGPEQVGDRPLAPDEDVSVGALIRSHFGDDVLERLVDPLLGGINAGDSDRLSLRAAAPQLAAAAERSASLIEGLRAAPPAPAGPVFWSLPSGMGSLADALVDALHGGGGVTFVRDAVDDLGALLAANDGVVLATPAAATASLLRPVGADAATLLDGIAHASPVLLALAFRRRDVRHALEGSGFLVPKVEGRMVTACSFASTKWAHLADPDPDGDSVLLRASAGRYGDDRAIGLDDDVLRTEVLRDLDDLLGLEGDPVEVRITRWRHGFPQYEPGHLDRVARIERSVAAVAPNVVVAGAAYRGIGVPACIRQGRAAAAQLVGPARTQR